MSRIYWDTMLFVYWLEDRKPYTERIAQIYDQMSARGDQLVTSTFTVAELLVAPRKVKDFELEQRILAFFKSGEVTLIPFDLAAADKYGSVRATANISPADSIHLGCAAAAGVDLFLTNDKKLRGLVVPDVQFIDGIETSLFGSP